MERQAHNLADGFGHPELAAMILERMPEEKSESSKASRAGGRVLGTGSGRSSFASDVSREEGRVNRSKTASSFVSGSSRHTTGSASAPSSKRPRESSKGMEDDVGSQASGSKVSENE